MYNGWTLAAPNGNMSKSEILVKQLNSWFDWVERTNKNQIPRFWSKNIVSKTIKQRLKNLNHWKDLSRGEPETGYVKMKENEINKMTNPILTMKVNKVNFKKD